MSLPLDRESGKLQTGTYIITNVHHGLSVVLKDYSEKHGPVVARADQSTEFAKWKIKRLHNGGFHIHNCGSPTQAAATQHGGPPTERDCVETLSEDIRVQQWTIRETESTRGNYIISVQGGEYCWGLPYRAKEESYVKLAKFPNHEHNHWIIHKEPLVEAAAETLHGESNKSQRPSLPPDEESAHSHDKPATPDDFPQPSTRSTKDSLSPYPDLGIKGSDLSLLSQYDTIFLVDDSLSMSWSRTSDGRTCWNQARECLMKFAEVAAKYNSKGIDVYFLNHKSKQKNLNVSTDREVQLLFDDVAWSWGSKVGRRLAELTKKYRQELSARRGVFPRPRNYIIITDGHPSDPQPLKDCLDDAAAILYKHNCPLSQLGFQFVQVGDSRSATKFLEELDGDKKQLKRDIVDTVKYSPNASMSPDNFLIKKILLGGINRFYDSDKRN